MSGNYVFVRKIPDCVPISNENHFILDESKHRKQKKNSVFCPPSEVLGAVRVQTQGNRIHVIICGPPNFSNDVFICETNFKQLETLKEKYGVPMNIEKEVFQKIVVAGLNLPEPSPWILLDLTGKKTLLKYYIVTTSLYAVA